MYLITNTILNIKKKVLAHQQIGIMHVSAVSTISVARFIQRVGSGLKLNSGQVERKVAKRPLGNVNKEPQKCV